MGSYWTIYGSQTDLEVVQKNFIEFLSLMANWKKLHYYTLVY